MLTFAGVFADSAVSSLAQPRIDSPGQVRTVDAPTRMFLQELAAVGQAWRPNDSCRQDLSLVVLRGNCNTSTVVVVTVVM